MNPTPDGAISREVECLRRLTFLNRKSTRESQMPKRERIHTQLLYTLRLETRIPHLLELTISFLLIHDWLFEAQ